jgi:hypothetical protein
MSLSEKVQQLNREIGSAMEHALDQVRQEVSQWLSSSNEEILSRLAALRADIPDSFVAHDDLAPAVRLAAEELSAQAREEARKEAAAQSAASPAPVGGAAELCAALSSIDRARSQADVLNALLQEAGGFASRAAVLLLRGGEVRGWSGTGFGGADAAIRQVNLGIPGDGSWNHAFQGKGPTRLTASDCALLCSRIEVPLAQEGVLIPMILRDRVAAAVYADRVDGGPLAAEALQVLAYAAGLAIESLPFRERASTATLAALAGEPAAPPSPPVPDIPELPELPELETPAAPAPVAAEPTEPEIPPALATAALPMPEVEPPAEAGWSAPATPGWESPAAGATFTDTEVEIEAEPEPAAAAPGASGWTSVEETSPYALEDMQALQAGEAPPALSTGWAEPAAVEPAVEPEDEGIPTQQVDLRPLHQAQRQAQEPPPASGDATVLLQRPNLREVLSPPAPVAPVEERPAPPTPIRPGAAPPAPPASVATADDTSPSLAGTPEVRPPSDLQGPGWAFASARVPVAPSDEAMHEEARRLARLLVSEIKLYNEEQVEEGRRKRDVYERLREDIDRSRQMYEERVEPRILKTTDYFYQELVRILAAGDARALGI